MVLQVGTALVTVIVLILVVDIQPRRCCVRAGSRRHLRGDPARRAGQIPGGVTGGCLSRAVCEDPLRVPKAESLAEGTVRYRRPWSTPMRASQTRASPGNREPA